jgi:hypothetical protein
MVASGRPTHLARREPCGLDMIDLVRDIESTFGVTITDADAEGTRCTIRSVTLLVAEKAIHN